MLVRDATTAVLPPSEILYLNCKIFCLLFVVHVSSVLDVLSNRAVERLQHVS
jgi:hypothetical protein